MFNLKVLLILTSVLAVMSEISKDNSTADDASTSKVLSRRKRFLTFPVGSSLQLVFCVQTAAIIPIGDIFLFGNTAALAWTLPSDPFLFDQLKESEKLKQRMDTKIAYIDENGRVLSRVPYNRKTIVNPAFAKRSIEDDKLSFKEKLKLRIHRMREDRFARDFLERDEFDKKSIEFHRNTRTELFEKIEKLLTALGNDGRLCVLYNLCKAAQHRDQGTFMQEFMRAVFTLPKGPVFDLEYHREYDNAHTKTDDCIAKYPGCHNIETL